MKSDGTAAASPSISTTMEPQISPSLQDLVPIRGGYRPPQGLLEVAFPGHNGIPFRGRQLPLLKQEEADQLEEVWDHHSQIFDLSVEDSRSAYNKVCDNAAKGIVFLRVHHVQWPDNVIAPRIFVAWLARYAERHGAKFERAVKDENGQISFRSS